MPATVPTQAIFLSYAREDTEAARGLAEALRAAGLEAWFDQSELRGGEAWDQKIRNQIRTCTLLVPVISANTQNRGEGYFRREWKMAAERTHDMAAGIPFLVPVVIDDTPESAALVPEEFMRVQWTRLAGGAATPQFVAQVKRLLEAPRGGTRRAVPAGVATTPPPAEVVPSAPPPRRIWPLVAGLAAAGAILALVMGLGRWQRPVPAGAAPASPAAAAAPTPVTPKPAGLTVEAKAVAVLPFENLSAEPDSAYFAEGMHEEVRMAVSKVSSLKVIARSSVLPYADAKKRDLKEIAAKLGVASVVEGTVRRQGIRVRIAVQLVDTRTATELWSGSYDKDLTDMFAVQAAIAQEVAGALKTSLTPGERAALAEQRTQNPEAYRLYLQGIAGLRGMGIPGKKDLARVKASMETFERAAAADPNFVLPQLQLTMVYGYLFWFGDFDPSPVWAQRSEAAAERVRQLAPGSPEARLAAGLVNYSCRNDWQAALEDFRAAQAGYPNAADPVRWEAVALRRLGRWPETLERYQRLASLSPQDLLVAESLTETLLMMRRYRETVRTVDEFLARGESSAPLLTIRALAQFALDGDLGAYRNALLPLRGQLDGVARIYPWRADVYARDFSSAEQYLSSGPETFAGPGGVVNNPVAYYRTITAQVQGDQPRAREQAREARRYFEDRVWTNRQQSLVAAELAFVHAIAGERDLARVALARSREMQRKLPDAFVEAEVRAVWGAVLILLGDREGALGELRQMYAATSPLALPPPYARFDPFWSQLKDDPRFEEIIRSAKPL